LKPNKSPGEDGIISEFYITHWEQIKDEFFLLVNDTFDKKEVSFSLDEEQENTLSMTFPSTLSSGSGMVTFKSNSSLNTQVGR
jgi:hypothetical protein